MISSFLLVLKTYANICVLIPRNKNVRAQCVHILKAFKKSC